MRSRLDVSFLPMHYGVAGLCAAAAIQRYQFSLKAVAVSCGTSSIIDMVAILWVCFCALAIVCVYWSIALLVDNPSCSK